MIAAYWIVIIFLIAQRLGELFYSKRNQRRLLENGYCRVEPGHELALMVGLHVSWFLGLMIEPLLAGPKPVAALFLPAAVCFAIAQGLRIWVLWTLGEHWNVSIMAPRVQRPDAFVRCGPYRFMRHPNYVAVILEFFSVPLLGGAYFTAIVGSFLNLLVLRMRVRREDLYLHSRPGYSQAFASEGV